MWHAIAKFILRFRIPLFVLLVASTTFMAWEGTHIHMDYALARIIPETNPHFIEYKHFQEQFGQDGNVLVIAAQHKPLFDVKFYNEWRTLGDSIKKINGMEQVVSVADAYMLTKDADNRKFKLTPFPEAMPKTQAESDSIGKVFDGLRFYDEILVNRDSQVTIMAARFIDSKLTTKEKLDMVAKIERYSKTVETNTGAQVHLSGLPFIRNDRAATVSKELVNVTFLAVFMLALLLFIMFRSFAAVFYPFLIVGIGVVWAMGLIVLFGFKITLLTALIPTLIIIIGIPNSIYMLNKFHTEYRKHGDKMRALAQVIERVGYSSFFANITTAIGFGVFYFTNSAILVDFGILSGAMIVLLYIISVVSLPIILSFIPAPKERAMGHLDAKRINFVIEFFIGLSHNHRKLVYAFSGFLLLVSVGGIVQLSARGFILDDVPKTSRVYRDMKFMEKHFTGIMPLEILIDTKKKGGALSPSTLRKIDALQDSLHKNKWFGKPTSIANGLKFATQAFYNGNPNKYRLPASGGLTPEIGFVMEYLTHMDKDTTGDRKEILSGYVDSTKQIARISLQIPDIGSDKLDSLRLVLDSIINPIFDKKDYTVTYTGTSIISMEGFRYIAHGLAESVVLSLFFVGLVMLYLFRNARMLTISLIPNLIPLFLTAGIMGYTGITLKPSTVLVFSIAFGLSSDFTIYFLSKYKLEVNRHEWNVSTGIIETLRETGISMIYTAMILFFGFFTFMYSDFDGTKFMGMLVSITLASAIFSNVILLPALLLSFDKLPKRRKWREMLAARRKK